MVQQTIREALIYGANKVNADAYVGKGTLIPMEALTYCCNSDTYRITACASSQSLSKKDKTDIFNLVESNLKVQVNHFSSPPFQKKSACSSSLFTKYSMYDFSLTVFQIMNIFLSFSYVHEISPYMKQVREICHGSQRKSMQNSFILLHECSSYIN